MKIQRIEPGSTKLTTKTGQAPKDVGMETRVSRAGQALAQVSQQVAQKFAEIEDKTELLNANTEARKRHIELEQKVTNNPDEWKDKYQSELEKIKADTSGMISLPASRNEYGFSYDAMELSTRVNINNTIRKHDIYKRQTAIFDNVNTLEEQYIMTDNIKMKEMLLNSMRKQFKEAAKEGVLTPIQAKSNIEAQEKKFVETDIKNEIAIDLDEAERKIIAGEFPLVTAGEKESYLKIIDTARAAKERKFKKEKSAKQMQNGRDLGIQLARGEADIVDVIEMTNSEAITPEISESAFNYLAYSSDQEYMITDEKSWNYVMENALDPKMDMSKFYGILFEAKLSGKDAEMFLAWADEGYNYIDNYKTREPKWEFLDSAIKSMKDFVGNLYKGEGIQKALYNMSRTLFEQVNSGEIPTEKIAERSQKLMGQEVIKSVKGADNLPKNGGIFVDVYGNKVKIYPDGKLEEVD